MFWTVSLALFKGLGTAAELFALTLLFSLPLGLLVSFGSMNKWAPLRNRSFRMERQNGPTRLSRFCKTFQPIGWFTDIVVWIIRGTPLMLQLMIIYYAPGILSGQQFGWGGSERERLLASLMAFVINYACYFSVIYRGGIEGVPVGQREAGQVLGMTKTQIFFKITLLQMVKRVVPPMSNEIITLVKDTSLARIISLTELIKAGERFLKSDGLTWPLFYTGVYYLIFVGILTIVFSRVEKKLNYFRV